MKTRTFIGPDFFPTDKKSRAMKLALGLDVQTNAKGGKFMSIEDSRQGALVDVLDIFFAGKNSPWRGLGRASMPGRWRASRAGWCAGRPRGCRAGLGQGI